MSMLAGPRRKQKVINLRAKNNAWSNDANKFGQKMLEKMGWSAGKGLGAKENGITEHVVARYKNDEKGLGFEDKNDQWTKHEDDFNALLANLSNSDSNAENLHSGISLERKSKKSKARIHYHKFTRGKDLSRYSEKDLANIFGKKSFKEEAECEGILAEDLESTKEEVKNTEQVFTEKGTMDDYFKNKLANLKNKSKLLNTVSSTNEDQVSDYGFKGFSNDSEPEKENISNELSYQTFSFYGFQKQDNSNTPETSEDKEKVEKKKKKKSKNKDCFENDGQSCDINENGNEDQNKVLKTENEMNKVYDESIFKEKKKNKKKCDESKEATECEPPKKKKKCKNKSKEIDQEHAACEDDETRKKKKKRKNKE